MVKTALFKKNMIKQTLYVLDTKMRVFRLQKFVYKQNLIMCVSKKHERSEYLKDISRYRGILENNSVIFQAGIFESKIVWETILA